MILFRSSGKTLSYDEFWQMKEELAMTQGFGIRKSKKKRQIVTVKTDTEVDNSEGDGNKNPITTFIRDRYRNLLDNHLNTVIFIIFKSDKGLEVSGHIDLNQRAVDDPNFQKYLKGTRQIMPQQGDLTYHNWNKGRTLLSNSTNWDILTESGVAWLKNKHLGTMVKMDIFPTDVDVTDQVELDIFSMKRKGKKESSSRWTEIETERESGLRIMFWDLYLNK